MEFFGPPDEERYAKVFERRRTGYSQAHRRKRKKEAYRRADVMHRYLTLKAKELIAEFDRMQRTPLYGASWDDFRRVARSRLQGNVKIEAKGPPQLAASDRTNLDHLLGVTNT